MWHLVCWGQCEGTTSSPNVTQEDLLVPSLLSFCVFTEVLASSCCSFSSSGRQVRGSDIMKQNRDSPAESGRLSSGFSAATPCHVVQGTLLNLT